MGFYSFEGGECSGKTTTLVALKEAFIKKGSPFILTREPGGTKNAELIREVALKENLSPATETLLMYAARNEHFNNVIKPALEKNITVLSDRFSDSTAVYQFLLHNKTYDDFLAWERFMGYEGNKPDLTFLLDIPVEEMQKRMQVRGTENKFDKLGFEKHITIRNAYLEIYRKNPERIILLDGTQPTNVIVDAIMNYIENKSLT